MTETSVKKEKDKYPFAVYLVLQSGNEVLLSKRFNTGYADGMYSLPAGHVDIGESAIQAMVREAKEEIDITILPEDLVLKKILHRKKCLRIVFFRNGFQS